MKKSLWNLDHWLGDRIGDKKAAIFCQTKQIFAGRSQGATGKKSAKYGGKWAFLGQTACHLKLHQIIKGIKPRLQRILFMYWRGQT